MAFRVSYLRGANDGDASFHFIAHGYLSQAAQAEEAVAQEGQEVEGQVMGDDDFTVTLVGIEDALLGARILGISEWEDDENAWTALHLDNGFVLNVSGRLEISRPLPN